MEKKRVTLKDVAEACGVSVMSVSYALRGSKQVSDATRERVSQTAMEMGYQPDPLMTRLSSYRSRKLRAARGVAMGWLNLHPTEATWNFRGSHFLESFEGAQQRAQNLGYQLEPFCIPHLGGWKRVTKILRSRGIQAVVFGQPPAGVHAANLDWRHFASVAIGRALRSPELPRVVFNHVEAVNRLIDEMRGRRYRRIGLVMELAECVKNSYRNVSAYYGATERLDLPADERVPPLIPKTLTPKNLGDWIRAHRVDGIIVHREDQMKEMLPQLGLAVPKDIGFAHLSMHEKMPGISGFVFRPQHYGSWAVDLSHWLLDREEKGIPDPVPSLMLTAIDWNEGNTLRRKPKVRGDSSPRKKRHAAQGRRKVSQRRKAKSGA